MRFHGFFLSFEIGCHVLELLYIFVLLKPVHAPASLRQITVTTEGKSAVSIPSAIFIVLFTLERLFFILNSAFGFDHFDLFLAQILLEGDFSNAFKSDIYVVCFRTTGVLFYVKLFFLLLRVRIYSWSPFSILIEIIHSC